MMYIGGHYNYDFRRPSLKSILVGCEARASIRRSILFDHMYTSDSRNSF